MAGLIWSLQSMVEERTRRRRLEDDSTKVAGGSTAPRIAVEVQRLVPTVDERARVVDIEWPRVGGVHLLQAVGIDWPREDDDTKVAGLCENRPDASRSWVRDWCTRRRGRRAIVGGWLGGGCCSKIGEEEDSDVTASPRRK
ncbi:hypothetical protein PR202_gb23951 [Eleusine coracana subsp. coracana]|uniref:Uncharacterized protein n=1 Tax=Eleusine coracana subsp. coracana TaxID=191504 RepID=A0AAV5FKT1_ELECO|nr:hypothetical protein PR202_gb23951 [Eleusine coracana subsp. coracana]